MSALEYVRRTEGLRSWGEAKVYLLQHFPALGPVAPLRPIDRYEDWCSLPKGFLAIPRAWRTSILLDEARAFAAKQWGVSAWDLNRWGCGVCAVGRYAWRLVIPIVMEGRLVGFQARTMRRGEPKYLTSRYGDREDPEAECGRPADAMLFNLDAVTEGCDVILVEGAGDAMALAHDASGGRSGAAAGEAGRAPGFGNAVPVALLGLTCSAEKGALLHKKTPGRVIVAVDAEPEAEERGRITAEMLCTSFGLTVSLGLWKGAKDAGAGGQLQTREPVRETLLGRAAQRMAKWKPYE
jgi:hypothetical protein